jgi:hypothetical protein
MFDYSVAVLKKQLHEDRLRLYFILRNSECIQDKDEKENLTKSIDEIEMAIIHLRGVIP